MYFVCARACIVCWYVSLLCTPCVLCRVCVCVCVPYEYHRTSWAGTNDCETHDRPVDGTEREGGRGGAGLRTGGLGVVTDGRRDLGVEGGNTVCNQGGGFGAGEDAGGSPSYLFLLR